MRKFSPIFIVLLLLLVGCDQATQTSFESIDERRTIPFETTEQDDPSLPEGETKVERKGRPGKKLIVYHIETLKGREISRTWLYETKTLEPQNEHILVGTLKTVTSTPQPLDFSEQTKEDPGMPRGTTRIEQAGVKGKKVTVYQVGYVDGEEVTRSPNREVVTKEPVPKITANGTGDCEPNHSDCIPTTSGVETSSAP